MLIVVSDSSMIEFMVREFEKDSSYSGCLAYDLLRSSFEKERSDGDVSLSFFGLVGPIVTTSSSSSSGSNIVMESSLL